MQLESFSIGWELLKSRFSNNCNQQIMGIYYKFLRDQLTDQEWAIAVERSILEESFFPSAKILVEKVKASPQDLSTSAWETILSAAKQGKKPDLDPTALLALKRIGGRTAIETATEDSLPYLKKDFVREFSLITNQQTREKSCEPSNSLASAPLPKLNGNSRSLTGTASAVRTPA